MKKVKYAFIPWDMSEEECKNRIATYPRLKEINCEVIVNPLSDEHSYEGYGFKVKVEDVEKWCMYTSWGNPQGLSWWSIQVLEDEISDYQYIPSQRRIDLD